MAPDNGLDSFTLCPPARVGYSAVSERYGMRKLIAALAGGICVVPIY
jgi:hypothetical protein